MLKDTETPVLAAQCYKTAPASYKQGLIFCLTRPRLAPIKDLKGSHFACTSLLLRGKKEAQVRLIAKWASLKHPKAVLS